MSESNAATRAFISYSSHDQDIVDRLKLALTLAGVDVWLDHERLTPGTPNWQVTVRDGINQATVVIYVASETAAISPYVIDEISLARGKGKLVIPFWARGEHWHDCAPLGWGLSQYTDGRGASFSAGLANMLAACSVEAGQPAAGVTPTPISPPVSVRDYQPPRLPARLMALGYRGVNIIGVPAIVPPLITVPAGAFQMGSDPRHDPGAFEDEKPQRSFGVNAFQIATHPVTVAEYALAVSDGAVRTPPLRDGVDWGKQLERPDHPVVCVSWQDASAYIMWLGRTIGQAGWLLPSEAQWEKAARWDSAHSVSRIYPWGDAFDQARCNTQESSLEMTTPVGSYPNGVSPYGVNDMTGNVREWTSSPYAPDPRMSSDGRPGRVMVRGGSWRSPARDARAACRHFDSVTNAYSYVGFRLACIPDATR